MSKCVSNLGRARIRGESLSEEILILFAGCPTLPISLQLRVSSCEWEEVRTFEQLLQHPEVLRRDLLGWEETDTVVKLRIRWILRRSLFKHARSVTRFK